MVLADTPESLGNFLYAILVNAVALINKEAVITEKHSCFSIHKADKDIAVIVIRKGISDLQGIVGSKKQSSRFWNGTVVFGTVIVLGISLWFWQQPMVQQ